MSLRVISSVDRIVVLDRYDDSSLRYRIWNALQDDWRNEFKRSHPSGGGREKYLAHMSVVLDKFKGEFVIQGGRAFNPADIDINPEDIKNFIGKKGSLGPGMKTMDHKLRYLHAYLLVKKPYLQRLLEKNDYLAQLSDAMKTRYITTDVPAHLEELERISRSMCGVFVTHEFMTYPASTQLVDRKNFPPLGKRHDFCSPYQIIGILPAANRPLLVAHLINVHPEFMASLLDDEHEGADVQVQRASGIAVPWVSAPEGEGRVFFYLMNRDAYDFHEDHYVRLKKNVSYRKPPPGVKCLTNKRLQRPVDDNAEWIVSRAERVLIMTDGWESNFEKVSNFTLDGRAGFDAFDFYRMERDYFTYINDYSSLTKKLVDYCGVDL